MRQAKLLYFMKRSPWHRYFVGVGTVIITLSTLYGVLFMANQIPVEIDKRRSTESFFFYNDLSPTVAVVGEPLQFKSTITVRREGFLYFDDTLSCKNGTPTFLNYKSETPTGVTEQRMTLWTYKVHNINGVYVDYVPEKPAECEMRSHVSLELNNGVVKQLVIITKFSIKEII